MRRSRTILLAAAAGAMALSAVGAPVAAHSSALVEERAFVVNGLPGQRLDVCVDGKEVKSRLRYGRKAIVALDGPGQHKFVFKRARPGKCKGATVAKARITYEGTLDFTVVAAFVNGRPGIRGFDNGEIPIPGTSSSTPTETVHHAARSGRVDIYRARQLVVVETPPIDWKGLRAGRSAVMQTTPDSVTQLWLTKRGKSRPIVGPDFRAIEPDHNIYVFVGTKASNFKLVKFVTGR